MRYSEKIKSDIDNIKCEISKINDMTEDEVCEQYSTENKDDAITSLEVSEVEHETVYDDYNNDDLDPAFNSWEQVNGMFFRTYNNGM